MLPYSTTLSFEVMDLSVGYIIFMVYLMSLPVVVCGGMVVNNNCERLCKEVAVICSKVIYSVLFFNSIFYISVN